MQMLPGHPTDLLYIGFSVKNLTYGPIIGGHVIVLHPFCQARFKLDLLRMQPSLYNLLYIGFALKKLN